MSFTYTESLTDDTSKARFALGDTDALNYVLEDAEISALITEQGSVELALPRLAAAGLNKVRHRASWSDGQSNESASDLVKHWEGLRKQAVTRWFVSNLDTYWG